MLDKMLDEPNRDQKEKPRRHKGSLQRNDIKEMSHWL